MRETFADFWRRLYHRNPKLTDEANRMTLSVAEFKRQLKRAYQSGQASADIEPTGTAPFSQLFTR